MAEGGGRAQGKSGPGGRALWAALVALATAASVAPLWSSELLPFQDAPQHVAAVRVLADWGRAGLQFPHWFQLDLSRSQYLGFYLPAALLAKAVGPQAACRLVLTLIGLALPAAAWMLLGTFGRDRRLAIFAPALFHSSVLYIGLFNFVASVPATIAAVALVERELRAPRPSRALLLAAAGLGLLYLHPTGVALAAGGAAFLAVTSGQPPRRMARALAPLAPAIAVLAFWASRAAPPQPEGAAQSSAPRWQPLIDQLRDAGRLGNVLVGRADEIFVGAVVAIFAALLALRALRPAPEPAAGIEPGWRRFRLALLALGTLGAYLCSPIGAGHFWLIHLRFLPFLALVALAAPPLPRLATSRRAAALLAAVAGLQAAYAFVLASAYRRFDAEAQPAALRRVLDEAAPGKRLLALIYDQESSVVHFNPYMHFGLYYELERGGRARFNFGELPWMPVRFRPQPGAVPLPANYEWAPEKVPLRAAAADADYVLVRRETWMPAGRFRLRSQAGPWAVYEPQTAASLLPASRVE